MKILNVATALLLVLHTGTFAQSTGFQSPTGTAAPNGWNNPTEAFVSDDHWTTALHQSGCKCPFVYLSWDNGVSFSSSQLFGPFGNTDVTQVKGGPTNTWGHSWTPAELSDVNFLLKLTNSSILIQQGYKFNLQVPANATVNGIEVRLEGHGDSSYTFDYVDHIEVNVYYSVGPYVDLLVQSVPSGVTVNIAPAAGGQSSLVTPGTFQCVSGPPYALSAPMYLGPPNCMQFQKWEKNGVLFSTTSTATISPGAGDTMTAYYGPMTVPPITTSPAGTVNACQGSTVSICANTTAAMYSYQWLKDGVPILSAVSPCYTATQNGIYQVILTLLFCVSDTSSPVDVTFQPPPAVSLSLPAAYCHNWGPQPLNGGIPTGGTYSGPGISGTHPNYVLNPSSLAVGNYTVTYVVADNNGCTGSASATIHIDPCTGMGSMAVNDRELLIYPNPGNGIFTVLYSRPGQGPVIYEVLNHFGHVIERSEIEFQSTRATLDISRLPAGMYYVRLFLQQAVITRKIIIQHM